MARILEIPVSNAADLLRSDVFGAGARIRVESSATGGGTGFTEIRTIPLTDATEYTFGDVAGLGSTVYRWRFSDAAGTLFSEYSDEVSSATDAYLSVEALREHISSDLSDDALQRLLAANTLAITQRAGPLGTVAVTLTPSRDRYLFLDRPVSAITSITEYFNDPVGISGIVLDSTDYRLLSGGTLLERWGYGTHPGDWWSDRVELVYTAVDDTAERIRVLIKLCELDLNRQPGLSAIRIGDYSEQSRNEAYNDEREAILATLVPTALTFA